MTADPSLSLFDYIGILRRRALLIAVTISGVFALAVAIALLAPPVYQSTGTILIESQQIPTDLVQATVTTFADERIETIKQRVMTRDNLLRTISKYKLFEDSYTRSTPSELIDEMRRRVGVELVNANLRGGRTATIAFKVSFEYHRPELAQRVANDMVTLFLDENIRVRTERAAQTTEFLTQEANKLQSELNTLEGQIAAYKLENGNALPDNMALSLNAMQRLETEMRDTERESRAAQEELRMLEVELAGAKAGLGAGPSAASQVASPAQQLEKARAELIRLSGLYTDRHPDIREVKRTIEGLEKSIAAGIAPASGTIANPTDLAVARIEQRISAVKNRITLLSSQQSNLRGRIASMESQLLRAPTVERGLANLMRNLESARAKYNEIRSNQMTAQVSENLEDDQKAERFSLLEPPLLPDLPVRPDRKKMIALGFLLAVAAAAGLVMTLETIQSKVRGGEALTAIVHQRPLITIPYITIPDELKQRQKIIKRLVIGAGVGILAALAGVHFLYMPLDLLFFKIMVRLG